MWLARAGRGGASAVRRTRRAVRRGELHIGREHARFLSFMWLAGAGRGGGGPRVRVGAVWSQRGEEEATGGLPDVIVKLGMCAPVRSENRGHAGS